MTNIIFLVPYPLKESPSQRFRFEQYFSVLSENGKNYYVQSFFDSNAWRLFFERGHAVKKGLGILKGFFKRFWILLTLHKYDFVFIHREAAPIGPPLFEWLIANILQKKIIYDFDDAIWLTDRSNESWFLRRIKWRSKVKNICRWSHKISCGNAYLCDYAQKFNPNVVLNPTTIDTDHHKVGGPRVESSNIIVGWTGSHSTLKYLKDIEPMLQKIEHRFPEVKIMIIADRAPDLKLEKLIFKTWTLENEISDLRDFDIGIMPLPDDEWSKGKCGFKALQYMALEIPTIASPIGVNKTIVEDGSNGFLADSLETWERYLTLLITDRSLRSTLGKRGRDTVTKAYSVKSNSSNFLTLFT